jgi:hypothetical protein
MLASAAAIVMVAEKADLRGWKSVAEGIASLSAVAELLLSPTWV